MEGLLDLHQVQLQLLHVWGFLSGFIVFLVVHVDVEAVIVLGKSLPLLLVLDLELMLLSFPVAALELRDDVLQTLLLAVLYLQHVAVELLEKLSALGILLAVVLGVALELQLAVVEVLLALQVLQDQVPLHFKFLQSSVCSSL